MTDFDWVVKPRKSYPAGMTNDVHARQPMNRGVDEGERDAAQGEPTGYGQDQAELVGEGAEQRHGGLCCQRRRLGTLA